MTFEQGDETRMDMGALALAISSRFIRIILITIVLLVVTYFILQLVPKQYVSSASLLVESRQSVYTRATNDVAAAQVIVDPSIVVSHAALIKSRDTIVKVIEKENLQDVSELNGNKASLIQDIFSLFSAPISSQSNKERVIFTVAKRTKVMQLPGSGVIRVSFRSSDPQLSARVANALVRAHVQRRSESSIADTANASQWLLEEITALREGVAEAEAKVATYRIENDLFVGANNTSILDQQMSNISTQITSSQERGNQAQSRATLIRGLLRANRPVDGVPDVRSSIVVQRLSQDKAKMQGERAQLLATRLPNHPDIKALSAQIVEVDKQILIEGRQVANALEAEAKIEADLEQSLRDDLTRLKIDVSGATKNNVALSELEREAKAQRDLLNAYLIRYRDAASRTSSNSVLPDVRVVTMAAPSIRPASPKKGFILLAVAFLSLTLQFGAILFGELLSGRAISTSRPVRDSNVEQNFAMNNSNIADGYVLVKKADYENITKAQPAMPQNIYDETRDFVSNPLSQPIVRPSTVAPKTFDKESFDSEIVSTDIKTISEQIAASYRLVLITSLGSSNASRSITQNLSSILIPSGVSVAEIDAGSKILSSHPGITDLCDGEAQVEGVVQRRARSNFAFVPWGQKESLNLHSDSAKKLVTGLGDVFETVLVDVGRAGMTSSLSAFSGMGALVVLVVAENSEKETVKSLQRDIHDLGFSNLSILKVSASKFKVA